VLPTRHGLRYLIRLVRPREYGVLPMLRRRLRDDRGVMFIDPLHSLSVHRAEIEEAERRAARERSIRERLEADAAQGDRIPTRRASRARRLLPRLSS